METDWSQVEYGEIDESVPECKDVRVGDLITWRVGAHWGHSDDCATGATDLVLSLPRLECWASMQVWYVTVLTETGETSEIDVTDSDDDLGYRIVRVPQESHR